MVDLSRFFCCMVMHMGCSNKINEALRMMKYVTNHQWKFISPNIAYFASVAEVIAIVFIALTNYVVITETSDIMELAKDFTALTIISEIGQIVTNIKYFDGVVAQLLMKKKFKKLFKIETTTSIDAQDTSNIFLEPDAVHEKINKKRALKGQPPI